MHKFFLLVSKYLLKLAKLILPQMEKISYSVILNPSLLTYVIFPSGSFSTLPEP